MVGELASSVQQVTHSRERLLALLTVSLLAVVLLGCQGKTSDADQTSATKADESSQTTSSPSASASTASATPSVGTTPAANASTAAGATPSVPSTARPAGTHESAANHSQTLSLAQGKTAHLTYFDVTFLRFAAGQDGVSHGWKVRVCYTSAHPGQNSDGTTRVSTNPWSVLVRDGEGGQEGMWVRIDDFPADKGWAPPYPSRRISVGQCAEGWLAIRDENPDLQWLAVRYAPADFGDQVTWGVD